MHVFFYRLCYPSAKNRLSDSFGSSTSQHCKLLHDDTQYLLALAIADKAIYGVNSVEEFWELQIPSDQDELPLRWNAEVENLPVLRNATMNHIVSEEPLPKNSFDKILKAILKLSGYFGHPTVLKEVRGAAPLCQ